VGPTENQITEAMNTIKELCLSVKSCGECALFSEESKRCILRTATPSGWKLNEPPAEKWRAIK
jgi:hypothetical protein